MVVVVVTNMSATSMFVSCLLQLSSDLQVVLVYLAAFIASQVVQQLFGRRETAKMKRFDLVDNCTWGMVESVLPDAAVSPEASVSLAIPFNSRSMSASGL